MWGFPCMPEISNVACWISIISYIFLNLSVYLILQDLSYKEKHWHEVCFVCSKCRTSLVDKQFGSKADRIYCGPCYDAQFATRCDGCGDVFRAGKSQSTVCLHREFMMKIPMAYHEAPTTKFRLFWDVDNWNFSNIKTYDDFRTLLLLSGLPPFSQFSSS